VLIKLFSLLEFLISPAVFFTLMSYASALKNRSRPTGLSRLMILLKSVILDALQVSLGGGSVECKSATDVRQHTARSGMVVTVGVCVLVAFLHYVLLMAIISLEWKISPSRY
jgi:hypothetical protein